MRTFPLVIAAGAVVAAIPVVALIAGQQAPRPSVYTAAQAAAGRQAYTANCAGCHQPDLRGQNEALPLAGPNFMTTWGNRSTRLLFEYIQGTMPPGNANLSEEQYLSIVAFILQSNGATPGGKVRQIEIGEGELEPRDRRRLIEQSRLVRDVPAL